MCDGHSPLSEAALILCGRSGFCGADGEVLAIGSLMDRTDLTSPLTRLFGELVDGASGRSGAFILNSGDVGLLRSLDKLSAAEASRSANGGATIAAHAQHVRYGLSLMNRWAAEGGDPFADAMWDEAWTTSEVDSAG